MDRLLSKIYNLEFLDRNDIKAVKKYFAALNFILVEDNSVNMPRKILTTKGIFELIDNFETEKNKCSEITENYPFGKRDIVGNTFFMSEYSYEIYKNSIVTYLLTHKNVLVKYLNEKYNVDLKKEDLDVRNIIKNSLKISNKRTIKTKRNKKVEKQNVYIRTEHGTFLIAKCNKIFLLKRDNNERRNIIKSEYRRNGSFYKDERSFTNAYIS